jgi:hypothetical protein
MLGRKSAWTLAVLAASLAALLVAGPASAKRFQPLNQYFVTRVSAEDLARAGYDMHEAVVKGRKGFAIVATSKQANVLKQKGARVRAIGGVARRSRTAARASQFVNPTHGYDVFRPWSLTPAPCPDTCARDNVPLKVLYRRIAQANPDVVEKHVIGRSVNGQRLIAYRVTDNVRHTKRGKRPTVLYNSTQHAREWIATEVEYRLFKYVVANKNQGGKDGLKNLLKKTEMWFVPIVNPDGYNYTFQSKATRLWRKNLRDVNGDGQITNLDGVDTNRNFPEKWNYDLEGASDDSSTETYHGAGPASEPEVRAMRRLERRIQPKFQIDYHSFAQLILYPEGWQVETLNTDWPITTALAGDDDNPAVEGFDPDVSAELYTTNGDITDDSLKRFGIEAFTVELSGGTGDGVGGTVDGPDSFAPGGFVFQDDDAAIQAEFEKNVQFALDLARSAGDPDDPVSHLGNKAPALVPTTFSKSFGDPQVVEVNAKRSLGKVEAVYQINGGRKHDLDTREFKGGEKYGEPGVYYHHLRATIRGAHPGDQVKVWFESKNKKSDSFTYTLVSDTGNGVLLMVAEDYTGNSGLFSGTPHPGPEYQGDYEAALNTAGVAHDVYDVDAQGREAPSALGVLSHYKAVIWETGNDLYVRTPGQPGGTGTALLFDQEVMAVRDYLNEGGKALVAGQTALQGAWDQFLYNPLGPTPPNPVCPANQTTTGGNDDDPEGQTFNCVIVSNDFQQYWLGAWLPILAADDIDPAAALPFQEAGGQYGDLAFTLNGDPPESKQNQVNVYSFLTTSSILHPDTYPQFASEQAVKLDRPPAFDPPEGTGYAYSQRADGGYKRLTRTIDLSSVTAAQAPALQFQASWDTEPDFDYVFVEAHTVGQEDWTTLPDTNGNTSQDTGAGCPDDDPFWLQLHPFLTHYITRSGTTGAFECAPTGTSGAWNAATGNSAGWQDWNVDLSAYAGKQVEVSITYQQDPAVSGLGVFVDDTKVVTSGGTLDAEGFETAGDLGPWTPTGPPEGSPGNANNWIQTGSVGFVDGPGVATGDTLYWGYGLEGVTGADSRAQLMRDALGYLGAG